MSRAVSSWQSSVEREVGVGATVVSTHNNLGVSLPCNVCHVTKTVLLTKTLPPDALTKRLKNKGWHMTNRGQTCPECVKTRPNANRRTALLSSGTSHLGYAQRALNTAPQPTEAQRVRTLGQLDQLFKRVVQLVPELVQPALPAAPAPAPAAAAPPAPAPAPVVAPTPPAPVAAEAPVKKKMGRPLGSKTKVREPVAPAQQEITQVATAVATQPEAEPTEAAKLAHRKVMQLLEDYYIGQQGRYVNNEWNDARVAAESGGASVASVIQVREKWFGTLRENPELTALRAEMQVVASEMEALLGQVDQVEQDARAAVAQLRQQTQGLAAQLEKLTARTNKLS